MRPTRNFKLILWTALGIFLVVLLSGNPVIAFLLLPVVTLAVFGLLLPAPQVTAVYRRGVPRMTWTGESLEIELEVHIEGGVGLVSIHETLPEEFELIQGNSYRVFWVWQNCTRAINYTVVCRKRGAYSYQPTHWASWHGLYLREERTGTADNAMALLVLPKPGALPYMKVTKEQAHLPHLGATLRKVGVSADDFRDLRQYQTGDPLKAINWKATARRLAAGSRIPVTNQYESEGRRAAWILIDASSDMIVGNTFRNPLELCLHLAMGAARHFLKRGYLVGLYPYGTDAPILYPDSGSKQLIRISRVIAGITPGDSPGDLFGAVQNIRASLAKGSPLCLVFTRLDVTDPEPLKAGVKRLSTTGVRSRRRALPIVVGVNGYHCLQAGDWYERNAQMLLYLSTRPLVKALHSRGAKVLEWQPAEVEQPTGEPAAVT